MGDTSLRWVAEATPWFALLIALSPTLYDLVGHWQLHAWSRYSLGFLPLLILAIRADGPGRALRGPALTLVVLCLAAQLAATLASAREVARPLLGATLVGFLLYQGRARLRTALLAVFLIPAPNMLMTRWLGGTELANHLASAAAAVVAALGAPAQVVGPVLTVGELQLELQPHWSGVLLALQGLGLAWYYSARRDLGARSTAVALVCALLLAIPVQFGVLIVSALTLWAGQLALSGMLLDPGSWLLTLCVALYLCEVRDGARAPTGLQGHKAHADIAHRDTPGDVQCE